MGFIFLFIVIFLAARQFTYAAPPVNFQTTQVIGSGLDGPTGFAIAPDSRIFVLERAGKVKIYKNGSLLQTPFVDLNAEASGDRGLIGVAFDPDFSSNHYAYFYYTSKNDLLNKIVRLDASADVGINAVEIYRTNSPSLQFHVGGSLGFGPDGKLYFAVGDNGDTSNPQDLSNPHGKILRINSDGTVPVDNPFYGQAGKYGAIWAYGFRNPWRLSFDPDSGRLYVGDVGDATWEEIDLVQKGGNYGWPIVEGPCVSSCPYIQPIYAYNHNGASRAVALGPVYQGNMFPAEYKGDLFFGDYAGGFIKRLNLDSSGNYVSVADFDLNAGSVVDFKVAQDGSLYYITYFPGRLYKITYSVSNQTPIANSSADVTTSDDAPLAVHFSSSGTYDPDGDSLTYLWDFGDGTQSILANPTKIFSLGSFTVQLTVSDGVNSAQSVPIIINVGVPPTISIGAPSDGAKYKAGDTIFWIASAVDGRGIDLPSSAVSTEILLHHQTHIHPFLGPIVGTSGSFTVPMTGEDSAESWFEIKVSARDYDNLVSSKSVSVYPVTSNFTLLTSPGGMQLFLDGTLIGTPKTVTGVVSFEREIKAPLIQVLGGKNYQFANWSDGGAISRRISTPAADTTYVANYLEMPPFKGEYFTNMTLYGVPKLTRQDTVVDFNWGSKSPAACIGTDKFSVRWTKKQYFVAGKYKFTTTADDGVRIYVDGNLIINKWVNQPPTTYSADITLTAGEHDVKMEYFENTGGAVAKLFWEIIDEAPAPIPAAGVFLAQYFNNITLSGTSVVQQNEPAINFDWGDDGSPDPLIGADNFSARYVKNDNFEAGTYEFKVTADDGVRVYIDNVLILDKWIDQAATTYTVSKDITAGMHEVKVEYYEKTGGAVLQFGYLKTGSLPPPPPPTGDYQGYYWNAGNGSSPTIPTTAANLVRNDAEINFDWDGVSPDAAINADHFIARWKARKTFEAANYRFTMVSDDGIRVYLDNVMILDQWNDHAPTTYTVDKAVTAGEHDIEVEYYENSGGAVAKFSYAKIDTPPSGDFFVAEYFDNISLSGIAKIIRQELSINFNWGNGSPDPAIPNDHFSARFGKTETIEAGTYEFTVTADDGIRLFIDGQLVIDKWIDQPPTTYKVTKSMTAGLHVIKLEYYENGGGATIVYSSKKI